jgi:hypothetical protein
VGVVGVDLDVDIYIAINVNVGNYLERVLKKIEKILAVEKDIICEEV